MIDKIAGFGRWLGLALLAVLLIGVAQNDHHVGTSHNSPSTSTSRSHR